MPYDKVSYNSDYNKKNYTTIRAYVKKEEYPAIIQHMKNKGYQKMSEYIKDLISKDMENGVGGYSKKD